MRIRAYFIVGPIALALAAETLTAQPNQPAFVLLQPGSATNIQNCDGLKFRVRDGITVFNHGRVRYTLVRDGVSNVDVATGSGTGLISSLQGNYDLVSPPLPGRYTVVRDNGSNSYALGSPINVTFKAGLTCTSRPVRDFGGDMWFNGPTAASRPVVGDFDNDHREDDIAYFGLCGTPGRPCLRVHFGNGSTLAATERGGDMWFYTSEPSGSPAVGDLDGDGYRDDIVYYGRCGAGFLCLRAHFSDGTRFNTVQLGWDLWPADDTANSAPMVGDFDNDGKNDDVAYSGRCGNGGQPCWRVHIGQ
jgi:hypothetical protein